MWEEESEFGDDPKDRWAISSDGRSEDQTEGETSGWGRRKRSSVLDKLLPLAQANIQENAHSLKGQPNEFVYKEHTRVLTTKMKKQNIFANTEAFIICPRLSPLTLKVTVILTFVIID